MPGFPTQLPTAFNAVGGGREDVRIIDLTPAWAEQLLRANTNNRLVRSSHVEKLARDMRQGLWVFDGAPIRVGADGVLQDGQHRCLAVKHSGVTIKAVLVTGLSEDAPLTMDTGIARTSSDALHYGGIKVARPVAVAALARAVLRLQSPNTKFSPTKQEILRQAREHAAEYDEAAAVCNGLRLAGLYGSIGVFGVAYLRLVELDRVAALEFFESLRDGANLPKGSPILALRNYFQRRGPVQGGTHRTPLVESIDVIYRAWNAWRLGRAMQQIRHASGSGTVPR